MVDVVLLFPMQKGAEAKGKSHNMSKFLSMMLGLRVIKGSGGNLEEFVDEGTQLSLPPFMLTFRTLQHTVFYVQIDAFWTITASQTKNSKNLMVILKKLKTVHVTKCVTRLNLTLFVFQTNCMLWKTKQRERN
jgi:hypothetical protein